jgi:uncharacterized protein
MIIWAWIGALVIGLTLGLLGSGGSILTVPVLVYLVGVPDKAAIADSLAIVGLIAAVAAVPYALQRSIHWRSVLYFGVPGIAGTYFGAALSAFVSGTFQLMLFALVMLVAAVLMFRGASTVPNAEAPRQAAWKIALEGLAVGVLTGLVGVGGGFLIVPASYCWGDFRCAWPLELACSSSPRKALPASRSTSTSWLPMASESTGASSAFLRP